MPDCRRSTSTGLACQPTAVVQGTDSTWRLSDHSWEGPRTFAACDLRLTASTEDRRPMCVTALSGAWEDGWDYCEAGCTPACQRVTTSGARCLAEWTYAGKVRAIGCTTHDALSSWCATNSTTDYRKGWGYCASGCFEHARPTPGLPPLPPSQQLDCQRLTSTRERCLESWQHKGASFRQCTTAFSSLSSPWCKTADAPVEPGEDESFNSAWGWCKPGCAEAPPKQPCPCMTRFVKPCLEQWTYANYRHYGCTTEDAGGFEWCALTPTPLARGSLQQGLDWDYCPPGCAAPPSLAQLRFSPPPPQPPMDTLLFSPHPDSPHPEPSPPAGRASAAPGPLARAPPLLSVLLLVSCATFVLLLVVFVRNLRGSTWHAPSDSTLLVPQDAASSDDAGFAQSRPSWAALAPTCRRGRAWQSNSVKAARGQHG
ncbi:hypothetical protein T492DRAFT_1098653 [Pavlovales sp. CCMP2436]|nr:hypothetical protein T492DRAFT_1098653 [Pavlovales sp. CCMP2436]